MNIKRIIVAALLCALCGVKLGAQTYEELIQQSYDYADRGDLPAAEQALKAALFSDAWADGMRRSRRTPLRSVCSRITS